MSPARRPASPVRRAAPTFGRAASPIGRAAAPFRRAASPFGRPALGLGLGLVALLPACGGSGRAGNPDGASDGPANDGPGGADMAMADLPPDGAVGPGWSGDNFGPGVTPDAPKQFDGPVDGTAKLDIAYPLPDSMHAINVAELSVHWKRARPTDGLHRIRFENASGRFDFYASCKVDRCIYTLPDADWLRIARGNADGEVSLSVASTDGAGGSVALSAGFPIAFSPEPIRGGFYYWAASDRGTFRLNFGGKKATAFIKPKTDANPGYCEGCHSVSRNGRMIAFSAAFEDGSPNALSVARIDEPGKPTIPTTAKIPASAPALSPDGRLVVVDPGGPWLLYDAESGALLRTLSVIGGFPEWSPDGTKVAFMAYNQIRVTTFDGVDNFSEPAVLMAADTESRCYPTWSPDGEWIAFTSTKTGYAIHNRSVRLRLIKADGSVVYELGHATHGVDMAATWPKFTPFSQRDGRLFFLTFDSQLDYGLVDTTNDILGYPNLRNRPQLWMTAIDLDKLASGDPSTPPVWLPFQDPKQHNHMGYWTELLACGGATSGAGCGEGEECRAGVCVPL